MILFAKILLIAAIAAAGNPDISVKRDNSFTGRGNQDETLLKIMSSNVCKLKSVKVSLKADEGDVDSIHLTKDGKIIASAEVRDGKGTYTLRCNTIVNHLSDLRVSADIDVNAKEGGLVSADIAGMKIDGVEVTPEIPLAGAREILLLRQRLYGPGDYGSRHYRIPTVRQLSDGTLLTVNDRRNKTEEDLPGEIDVVTRYSTDGGKTWSEPVYIAKNSGPMFGYGDPSLVELEDGTVICNFCGGNRLDRSNWEDPQRSYYAVSKDHGRTWSQPVNITRFIWGPDPSNPFCKRYHSSFFTSGNSLILDSGPHKGRILVANVTTYDSWRGLCNHAVYSDDGGKTWNVSELAYADKGDESKMVQLLDGSILMSIRQNGERAYVVSKDDGQTWSEPKFWKDMKVTACNGDLIRYKNEKMLLHTVPDSMKRENVSVFVSQDEGKTWPLVKRICVGPSQYSSITVLKDGTIGAYIEENSNPKGTELWFETFSLDWLMNKK